MKREIDRAFKTMMVATAVHKKQHIKHYIEHMCIFASGANELALNDVERNDNNAKNYCNLWCEHFVDNLLNDFISARHFVYSDDVWRQSQANNKPIHINVTITHKSITLNDCKVYDLIFYVIEIIDD